MTQNENLPEEGLLQEGWANALNKELIWTQVNWYCLVHNITVTLLNCTRPFIFFWTFALSSTLVKPIVTDTGDSNFFINSISANFINFLPNTDLNECLYTKPNCHKDAHCHNIEGSYLCVCNRGFTGNDTHCEGTSIDTPTRNCGLLLSSCMAQ